MCLICKTAQLLPKGSGGTYSVHGSEHFFCCGDRKVNLCWTPTVTPSIAGLLALVSELVFVLQSEQDHANFLVYVSVMNRQCFISYIAGNAETIQVVQS